MATVYQRTYPNGSQAQTYTADIWIDGKKFSRSTGCKSEREAKKAALRLEAEVRAELARAHEPLTIDTMMARYWESHAAKLPSANSVKYHILRLLSIMDKDKPLQEMSNADVHDYVVKRSKMSVATATVNRELDVLHSAYRMARDLLEHPVRPIAWGRHRFPSSSPRDETLTPDEARHAIELLAPRSRDIADALELAIYTGLRKNELATLIWGRVDLDRRRIEVLAKRKARQEYRVRVVALSRPAVALLSERRPPGAAAGERVFDLKNFRKLWDWVRAQIGRTKVRWHDLRHTHGTLLGQTTQDTRIIQRQMGHTSITTTLRYVHSDHAQLIEAVDTIPALSQRGDANGETKPPSRGTSSGDLCRDTSTA